MRKIIERKYISYVVLIALLGSLVLMGGCQQTAVETGTPDDAVQARTIVDQAGREVALPLEVNRVISTWRPCTFLVYAVGGQDKLVGVDIGSTKAPFTTAVYPQIADIAQVGDKKSGINIEEVVAANPDVVFVWSGTDTENLIKQLEQQQIPAVVLIPESAEQMREATLLIGEIMDCSQQAEKILKYYDDTLALVAERFKDIPESERKKVFLAGADGFLSSCGTDFYQHYLIEQAGGINVAAELTGGWQEVSAEQVVSWNPDVIILDPYCKDKPEDAVKMNPGLKAITAVQAGFVYNFPSVGQWTFPIPQSAMGVLWLSEKLYPDLYEDLDVAAEADKYYKEFFGVTYSDIVNSASDNAAK
ncbi:MAG TPA: ABC transporter substrate-binding protein [Syntrophomonadaceae bacterium]|jgi:iron complex transport system substrate-binding protein|nr:ABC transporter substrate-binding protein [Bacillota bacterium]HQA50103.1 ABC transporter substrate-binding protein [Syntrophomonadaceae bacterium]HQD91397.1 ABC transporter substrate-binding protein [Syntrophomonadaceae bacterium]